METQVFIDSLVGPTHNFAGQGVGNTAAIKHTGKVSHPKQAALQGLQKMKTVADLGIPQVVFPPHPRPNLQILRLLGFSGADREVIAQASEKPDLLAACYSASPMWMANAATFTPSMDTLDHRAHLSLSNLVSSFHRSFEWETHLPFFEHFFSHRIYFAIHRPLPSSLLFRDEGSANHLRFSSPQGGRGIHLFVYGEKQIHSSKQFFARQTLKASEAIARRHQLDPETVLFAEQNQKAIDQGVFHNDVIGFGGRQLFVTHEKAFNNTNQVIEELSQKLQKTASCALNAYVIQESDLSLEEAIETYLFNSELLVLPNGNFALCTPEKALKHPKASKVLNSLPIQTLIPIYIEESLKNGGGPGCLSLPLLLTQEELQATNTALLLTDSLYEKLVQWIETFYRDSLTINDLSDFSFVEENQKALVELRGLLPIKQMARA